MQKDMQTLKSNIGGVLTQAIDVILPPRCVITGDGAFVVVANNFEAFGEAVRRKLILEIADLGAPRRQYVGMPKPRVFRAAGTGAVYEKGCDIGERQVQEFYRRRGWGN